MKLELRGITKTFGALVANDHIDLEVEPGEIHCLLGENGAGKSTLMNTLFGLYQADEGAILLDDVVQHFSGPGDAARAGIGMVHQHFMLIPVFTVAENVMLGHEEIEARIPGSSGRARKGARDLRPLRIRRRPGCPHRRPAGRRAAAGRDHQGPVARREGARVRRTDGRAHSAGDRRAHGDHAAARGHGTAIVFITHKLREVREVADKITVMRLGKVVGEAKPTASNAELASLMVGRSVELTVTKSKS